MYVNAKLRPEVGRLVPLTTPNGFTCALGRSSVVLKFEFDVLFCLGIIISKLRIDKMFCWNPYQFFFGQISLCK